MPLGSLFRACLRDREVHRDGRARLFSSSSSSFMSSSSGDGADRVDPGPKKYIDDDEGDIRSPFCSRVRKLTVPNQMTKLVIKATKYRVTRLTDDRLLDLVILESLLHQ